MKPLPILIILLAVFSLIQHELEAQRPLRPLPSARDTSKSDQVLVDYADVFEYVVERDTVLQKLLGNVELRQDSVYMYCDSAIILNESDVIAMGKVIIQQGDSISVFSDSLFYDGTNRIADLFGDVILLNGHQKLYTDQLNYDLNQKLATYTTGALLTNDTTQLTSKRGYYYLRTDEAYFRDSVQVVDPDFELRSDTLKFNTRKQEVTFLGPTLITEEESKIYCEGGFYKARENQALFTKNPQYIKAETDTKATADSIRYDGNKKEVSLLGNARFEEPDKLATADILRYDEVRDISYLLGNAYYQSEKQTIRSDTITYDQKKEAYATRGRSFVSDPPQLIEADRLDYDKEFGLGVAIGRVVWRDTSSNLTILCEQADYDEETDYLKAYGGRSDRALMISLLEEDSLFLVADTLVAFRPDSLENDSSRVLNAFFDVRIFKSNLQGKCDSLAYSTVDSMFRMYVKPMIWSDTSQFSADTINMQLANDKIDRIYLRERSFLLNSADMLFYNQIKGKYITAYFKDQEVERMRVEESAESVYYSQDETGAYLGVNKTECGEMILHFADSQIERIRFFLQPTGKFVPMQEANHQELKIPGADWDDRLRPKTIDDLFVPRASPPSPPPIPEPTEAELPSKPDSENPAPVEEEEQN